MRSEGGLKRKRREGEASVEQSLRILESPSTHADAAARAAESLRRRISGRAPDEELRSILLISPSFAAILAAFDHLCTASNAANPRAQSSISNLLYSLLSLQPQRSSEPDGLSGPSAQLDALARELTVQRSLRLITLLEFDRTAHLALILLRACASRGPSGCTSAITVIEQAESALWRAAKPHRSQPAPHVAFADCHRLSSRDALLLLASALLGTHPKLALSKSFLCRSVFKGLSCDAEPLQACFLQAFEASVVHKSAPDRLIASALNETAFSQLVSISCSPAVKARAAAMSLIKALVGQPRSSPLRAASSARAESTSSQSRKLSHKRTPSKLVALLRHLRWDCDSEHLRVIALSLKGSDDVAIDFMQQFTPKLSPSLSTVYLSTCTVLDIAFRKAASSGAELPTVPGINAQALAHGIRHKSGLVSFTTLRILHSLLQLRQSSRKGSKSRSTKSLAAFDFMLPPLQSVIEVSRASRHDWTSESSLMVERAYAVLHLYARERPQDFEQCNIPALRLTQSGFASKIHLVQMHASNTANALLEDESQCAKAATNAKQNQIEQLLQVYTSTLSYRVYWATSALLRSLLKQFALVSDSEECLDDTESVCWLLCLPSESSQSACKLLGNAAVAALRKMHALDEMVDEVPISSSDACVGSDTYANRLYSFQSSRLLSEVIRQCRRIANALEQRRAAGESLSSKDASLDALTYASHVLGMLCSASPRSSRTWDEFASEISDLPAAERDRSQAQKFESLPSEGHSVDEVTTKRTENEHSIVRILMDSEDGASRFCADAEVQSTQQNSGQLIHRRIQRAAHEMSMHAPGGLRGDNGNKNTQNMRNVWSSLRRLASRDRAACALCMRLMLNTIQAFESHFQALRLLDWLSALAALCKPMMAHFGSALQELVLDGAGEQNASTVDILMQCHDAKQFTSSLCAPVNLTDATICARAVHLMREGMCSEEQWVETCSSLAKSLSLKNRSTGSRSTMNPSTWGVQDPKRPNGLDCALEVLLRSESSRLLPNEVLLQLLHAMCAFPSPRISSAASHALRHGLSLRNVFGGDHKINVRAAVQALLLLECPENDEFLEHLVDISCDARYRCIEAVLAEQLSIRKWPRLYGELVRLAPSESRQKLAWNVTNEYISSLHEGIEGIDTLFELACEALSPSQAASALRNLLCWRLRRRLKLEASMAQRLLRGISRAHPQMSSHRRSPCVSEAAMSLMDIDWTGTVCERIAACGNDGPPSLLLHLVAEILRCFEAKYLDLYRLLDYSLPRDLSHVAMIEKATIVMSALALHSNAFLCSNKGLQSLFETLLSSLLESKALPNDRPAASESEQLRLIKAFESNDGSIAACASIMDHNLLGKHQQSRTERTFSCFARLIATVTKVLDRSLGREEGEVLTVRLLSRYSGTQRTCDQDILVALNRVDKSVKDAAPLAEAAFLFGTSEGNLREILTGSVLPREAWKRASLEDVFEAKRCALSLSTELERQAKLKAVGNSEAHEDIGTGMEEYATAAAYDPAFVVPATAHCLWEEYLTANEAAKSGLLALSIRVLASHSDTERSAGHSALAAFESALRQDVRIERKRQYELLLEVCLCIMPHDGFRDGEEEERNGYKDWNSATDKALPRIGGVQAQFMSEVAMLLAAPES